MHQPQSIQMIQIHLYKTALLSNNCWADCAELDKTSKHGLECLTKAYGQHPIQN